MGILKFTEYVSRKAAQSNEQSKYTEKNAATEENKLDEVFEVHEASLPSDIKTLLCDGAVLRVMQAILLEKGWKIVLKRTPCRK